MEIVCPNCATAYRVGEAAIGPGGRKVRCTRCGLKWLATPAFTRQTAFAALPPATDAALTAAFSDALLQPEAAEAPRAGGGRPEAPPVARDDEPDAKARPVAKGIVTLAALGPGFERFRKPAAAAARTATRRPARRSLTDRLGVPAVALAIALVAGLILARQSVVTAVPDLAGLYAAFGLKVNLRGLEFRNMTATRDIQEGRPVLIIEGEIANIAAGDSDVPPVRLAVRAGRQEVYAWSVEPARRTLAAGESIAFRTRLASPPAAADDIELRFAARRQLASGAR